MIGTLTAPTIASTAPALSPRTTSSIADGSAMNPRYKNSRISSEVSRASHTHQVPQVGLPQNEPVHSARKVNIAPVGASARASIEAMRALNIQPIAAQNAIARYRTIDIQAAGTWM